ncbi:hypothetical protein HXX76_005662 [Chlamydomonas incerta]|uniref:Uncharacterized protein n=1 Tax=Chlamydomonas incerta TaxID=51695 RepID=A0A835TGX2_CHLIN|nr:hypothetical protein HXX76_005662 [Chlamydomonas incerta]|eukprot:KAG2438051.1 hypothetical protein HXX76_005662 [Chlamydomonas incerta]
MDPFETPASNAYAAAADDRPATRSGGSRSRPASYVGRCSGLLPAAPQASSALPGSRAISNVAGGVIDGAGGLFSPGPQPSPGGDLGSLASAGASPGGGYGMVRPPTFGRTSGDPGGARTPTVHPDFLVARGRLGALDTLGSLGLPGEEDGTEFEPLGLDEVEQPVEPLSPVRASSSLSSKPAHDAGPSAGRMPAPPAVKSPGAGAGAFSGGGVASGPQSFRKMVSFTASLGPTASGEGVSRHEPVAGNSGAAAASSGTTNTSGSPVAAQPPVSPGTGGSPGAGDLSVAVFDVASLMAEAAADDGGRASLLDPSKPAVRRLLPPLWHASQAVCEPPVRTTSGGLALSSCNSGVVGAGDGTGNNSRANSRAASLNNPPGYTSQAAADMRALLEFSVTSPNATSYGDADTAEAALALGLLLQQSPPAGSAFHSELAAAAAAMAMQTSPGRAASRAPSGTAAMLGGGMFSNSARRSLPPMEGSRFASATGLTTGELGDVDVEPGVTGLMGRLAALSGPGAAGGTGASGSGVSGGGCALYRATTEGLEYVHETVAVRGRISSGNNGCGTSSCGAGGRSAATSGGVPTAAAAAAGGDEWPAAAEFPLGGPLRRSETASGALVPSSSGGGGVSQFRLPGGMVGATTAARLLSGTPAFIAAASGTGSGCEAATGAAPALESMRGRSFVMSARQRALLCQFQDAAAGGAAGAAAAASTSSFGGAIDDDDAQQQQPAHQRLTQPQLLPPDGLLHSNSAFAAMTPGESSRFPQRPPSSALPAGGSLLSPVGGVAADRARPPSWCAPGASPHPAGPSGLPLPPIQDTRARAAAERR